LKWKKHFSQFEKIMTHPISSKIQWIRRMNKVFTPLRLTLAAAKMPAGRADGRM
jgi:hypothetical protein